MWPQAECNVGDLKNLKEVSKYSRTYSVSKMKGVVLECEIPGLELCVSSL